MTTSAPSLASRQSSFHIPSLDGVRALAFLAVFLCHAGLDRIFPGGFAVTVFFFLSGYLITSLLRREFEKTGTIRFGKFYYRRCLRIFPPLFLTLGVALAMHVVGLLPGMPKLGPMLCQIFFMTNYYVALTPKPWEVPGGTTVLWSLAVEEHFYFVFPVLALFLMRRFRAKQQALFLGAICAACLAWRGILAYGFDVSAYRTHMGTDTRFDSMLYGCIMGLFLNPYMDRQLSLTNGRRVAMLACVLVLGAVSCGVGDSQFRETFRYTLQGIALMPLFYLAIVDHEKPWFRWLSFKPVRFLGVLSYTLYLFHWTVIQSLNHACPNLAHVPKMVVAFAISLAFAWAVHQYVEKPCARLRSGLRHESRPQVTPAIGTV